MRGRADARSPAAQAYRHLYQSAGWRQLRAKVLAEKPCCERCQQHRGELRRAVVVHHVEPHRGDFEKFYAGPFEALCKRCHDSDAQGEEKRGYGLALDEDGWPADPRHPANRPWSPET